MKHKLKIRLALWCYYHGLERLAYKLYPSIGWYIIGADYCVGQVEEVDEK